MPRKTFARLEKSYDDLPVTARELKRHVEEDPIWWKRHKLAHENKCYHPTTLAEMVAVLEVENPFFRYPAEAAPKHQDVDSESLTHELGKAVLMRLGGLSLLVQGHRLDLEFSEVHPEVVWTGPSKEEYRFDLVATVAAPPLVVEHWGPRLVIEVHVRHQVPAAKQKDISDARYPAIEIHIPDEIYQMEYPEMLAAEVEQLDAVLEEFLSERFRVNSRELGELFLPRLPPPPPIQVVPPAPKEPISQPEARTEPLMPVVSPPSPSLTRQSWWERALQVIQAWLG